jgi:hypothetical protein
MRHIQSPPKDQSHVAQTEWFNLVREAVAELNFGVVQILVHNAKVVQIEKTEKLRLDPNS